MNQEPHSVTSNGPRPPRAASALLGTDAAMTRDQIIARLDELTEAARARLLQSDPAILGSVGGAEIDFMTTEERAERHRLCLMLPTQKEEAEAAGARIRLRIAERKQRRANEQPSHSG